MIWVKTDAGRAEVQARALVKERVQRNLLLLIDGVKSEEMLLAGVAGLRPADFAALVALDLIAPLSGAPSRVPAPSKPESAPKSDTESRPVDIGELAATVTQMISSELGLRGFTLTLAVEKATTIEELREVAERALEQVRERKGLVAADKARRALFGT